MKITLISKSQWQAELEHPVALTERIRADEVLIVRGFMDEGRIDAMKSFCLEFRESEPASWHPCLDGCPDYHRIHENYPGAHVPAVQRGFYFHPWNAHFNRLNTCPEFQEIFELKRVTSNHDSKAYLTNLPSQGPIARLVIHQYPRGGGGQAEHIDPVSPFARVQTIIQASEPGRDYQSGGIYINDSELGVVNVDALTRKGDLILASPGVRHGVARVDPGNALDWDSTDGRWIIMPIIIHSDHVKDPSLRPKKIGAL